MIALYGTIPLSERDHVPESVGHDLGYTRYGVVAVELGIVFLFESGNPDNRHRFLVRYALFFDLGLGSLIYHGLYRLFSVGVHLLLFFHQNIYKLVLGHGGITFDLHIFNNFP